MTTQESSPRSEFDQLVTAVMGTISRRLGGEEQIGYETAREAEGIATTRRSGVYRRDNRPVPAGNGGQAVATGPAAEAGAVATGAVGFPLTSAVSPGDGEQATLQQIVSGQAQAQTEMAAPDSAAVSFEELRVDVDGPAPTMTVSGTIWRLTSGRLTWIAKVRKEPNGSYTGPIGYRDGNTSLRPGTAIRLRLTGNPPLQHMGALVTFLRPDAPDEVARYSHVTPHFREVGIEYDRVSDAEQTDEYELHDHPVRPADLPNIKLTVEDAFSRQGIHVTRTRGSNVIPLSASVNGTWSDIEMHDAMQQHWSEWKPGPSGQGLAQWQVWTLFAGQHDMGPGLGGIMFDDIGTAQRQGCAVFSKSFISEQPPNDPDPEAYVRRMRFWTAVHEIGHCFNLAHSWQKSLPTPWIPLRDEPEALSFMNYPHRFNGGPQAFFSDFRFFFSEDELRFLRHAPARFVQQGNIPWFDHHGFEQARRSAGTGSLELTLRFNRSADREGAYRFAMLEPVIGELKLTNTTGVPAMVDRATLRSDNLSILVQREGTTEARVVQPYLRYCLRPEPVLLQPNESLYEQVVLSSGLGGWQISEPGAYRVYAALRAAHDGASPSADGASGGQILADPITVRVKRPASREQERLADDVFTDTVGRVLALGGSRVLDDANDVLREVTERIPDAAVAKHSAACLATATAVPGKVLTTRNGTASIEARGTDAEAGRQLAERAYGDFDAAANTFGHIRLTQDVTRCAVGLEELGRRDSATQLLDGLAQTLEGRHVKPEVVQRVQRERQQIAGGRADR
ncbi:hypothetical protein [Streptomyces sp. NBC_00576]|uniref:hypothetical protein n=1 Tax=Streptomyces sp. NBC_00576 TaxID=2903665 RepID=UPI002E7FE735|nr:hypothetical protein [Streptomyces sp. NBC_00576]WUB69380.1 hypothetical protein OG734_04415 [Streptomyces sp. NBC_00576]